MWSTRKSSEYGKTGPIGGTITIKYFINASISWTIWPIISKCCVVTKSLRFCLRKKRYLTKHGHHQPIRNHLPFDRLSNGRLSWQSLGGHIDLYTCYDCVKFGISQLLGCAIANIQVSKCVSLAVISGKCINHTSLYVGPPAEQLYLDKHHCQSFIFSAILTYLQNQLSWTRLWPTFAKLVFK